MSSPAYAITPALFSDPPPATFIAATGTAAKILVDQLAAAAATSTAPALYGGGTVIDLTATSSDAASKDVQLYLGAVATTQSTGATGAMTTTTSTIVRASGSFITDGWQPGDLVMTFAPFGTAANASMDGVLGIVTGVAALTLTVNGTPFAALTLAAGTRVVRVSPLARATVAAGAGTNGTVASQSLIGSTLDGSVLRTEIKLGANNILAAAMVAATSALPAYVSIAPKLAQY